MTVLSINMAKQIQFVGKHFMRNFKPVMEVFDFCESKKVCLLSSGIDYRASEKVPRFAANGGGRSALDGRSLTLEAPGGVMHTFNNSTPIQSRRYQTNTKNYFDTFALAYFFALFNSTKISQLIRQYFTFGSFINYERLEESPARKEKSRFSWL